MSIKKLKMEVEDKKREIARLEGRYGSCSKCGKEGYLSENLCRDCYRKAEKDYGESVWIWLIGKKIANIEAEHTLYFPNLEAIILNDGTRISPNVWSDPISLEVEKEDK